jgi:hypothetical protein
MLFKSLILFVSIWFLSGVGMDAFSDECADYDRITAQLGKQYREQMIFSGFADAENKKAAAGIYEFWANPERGNWSLIAHKLLQFQTGDTTVTKDCALIVNSGKRFHLPQIDTNVTPALETTAETDPAEIPPSLSNCVPHGFYARILKRKYQEVPVLQALSKSENMVEIYGSKNSWTIAQTSLQSSRNRITGAMLRDENTGQEIRQFCSQPAFSGKSWGLFPFVEEHI